MLILDDRFTVPKVRALMPQECWQLMELPTSHYQEAVDKGATADDLYRMAGNSIPASMLNVVAGFVKARLELIDAFTTQRAPVGVTSLAPEDGASATPVGSSP